MKEHLEIGQETSIEDKRIKALEAVTQTHEAACVYARELLNAHEALHYHNPAHTWGEDMTGVEGGVVGNTQTLLACFKEPLAKSLTDDPDAVARYHAWELGVIAGAAFHDTAMESTVTEAGVLQRESGWEAGKNEYESFEMLRAYVDEELPETTSAKAIYLGSAEAGIKATLPNATTFAPFSEAQLAELPLMVKEALAAKNAEGETVYQGLRLDSKHATESLSGLLLSTADLAAARSSEVFYKTGNAEFFESKIAESQAALQFLRTSTIGRSEARALLTACQGWRKIQVGVALWQRERLIERMQAPLLQTLLLEELDIAVPIEVLDDVAEQIMTAFSDGMTKSVIDAAAHYQHFSAYRISESGDDELTPQECEALRAALDEMGANEAELEACLGVQGLNPGDK